MDDKGRRRRNELIRQIWADESGLGDGDIFWQTAERVSKSCRGAAPYKLRRNEWYKVLRQMIVLYLEECKSHDWEPSFAHFRKNMYVYGMLWRHITYEDSPVIMQIYSDVESLVSDDIAGFGKSVLE